MRLLVVEKGSLMRRFAVSLAVAGLAVAGVITAAPASATLAPPVLSVSGAVTTPATYTGAQLDALPQTTLPDTRLGGTTRTVTGVLLESLVNSSTPVLPAGAKNGLLRVVVTVSGPLGLRPVAVALGELDPGFGNHPALITNGNLVFPGDRGISRTVLRVKKISVAVSTAVAPVPAPAAGSVLVVDGRHTRTLTAAAIARLPQKSLTVSFLQGTAAQSHTEAGPTLDAMLRAAGICTSTGTAVAAVGSDGYVATVTPAEAGPGNRPLLLSTVEDGVALAQPRLITDGDVKGGRYVSGVVELIVSS
jgi:hypothetical protein